MIRPRTAVEAKIPAAILPSEVNWASTIATTTRIAARIRRRRRIVSRVRVPRETCETAGDMEANLAGGEAATKSARTFPYANWGPWMAVLGVLAALAVGIFLAVPALILGAQEGKIEARFPPDFKTSASFDKGDATAIAVDPRSHSLYADHENEVRVFGAGGEEIEIESGLQLEDSQGLAFDE